MISIRVPRWLLVTLGVAALLWLGLPMESDGPEPLQFAVHRFDMALAGIVLALCVAAVPEVSRRKRRPFLTMVLRGLRLRLAMLVVGIGVLKGVGAFTSPDYWDHSALALLFHLLGPARMLAGQSLVVSGLALCCTSEVLNHLVGLGVGELGAVYVFVALDAVVFAWMGMAAERGLAPFRVFQVVSRIGLSVAVVSVPLAFYGDRIGYWGVEPFAWLFGGIALAVLVPLAYRR